MENTHEVLLLHIGVWWLYKKQSTCATELWTELVGFFPRTSFLLEKNKGKLWLLRQVFGRYFVKNKKGVSLLLQGKQLTIFVDIDKICIFEQKWNFGKFIFTILGLISSQYFTTFLLRLVVILTNVLFLTYSEVCQYLEDLHILTNQYFKKLPLIKFWCSIKEGNSEFSEKIIKIIFLFSIIYFCKARFSSYTLTKELIVTDWNRSRYQNSIVFY